jgi:hypothetical protein
MDTFNWLANGKEEQSAFMITTELTIHYNEGGGMNENNK